MSNVFEVGQKVRVNDIVDGEVTYGPFPSTYGTYTGYVVRIGDKERLQRESDLTVIPTPPAFTVGDEVTYAYGSVGGKLVAGPFTSEYHDDPIWVVEKPNGTHMTPTQSSLTKVEAPAVKVGDRVRIVKDSDGFQSGEFVGLVGTLERIDGGSELAYLVRFGDGSGLHGNKDNGRWWCASVELVIDEDTYEYDGVVYDLTAEYRDQDFDSLRIKVIDGTARVAWYGEDPSGYSRTLEEAVEKYGPFTRVTD